MRRYEGVRILEETEHHTGLIQEVPDPILMLGADEAAVCSSSAESDLEADVAVDVDHIPLATRDSQTES